MNCVIQLKEYAIFGSTVHAVFEFMWCSICCILPTWSRWWLICVFSSICLFPAFWRALFQLLNYFIDIATRDRLAFECVPAILDGLKQLPPNVWHTFCYWRP